MGDWHVGDPVGFGNDIGAPEVPYMSYVRRDEEEKKEDSTKAPDQNFMRAKRLGEEALILERQGRYDEALVFIDWALEIFPEYPTNLNIKAMILDNSGRIEDALTYYDKALEITNSKTIRANKAQCLYRIARKRYAHDDFFNALDYVNGALALLEDDKRRHDYLYLKSNILNSIGRTTQAKKCRLLADNRFDELKELEKSPEKDKTMICITGTNHYRGLEPFTRDLVVELFEEAGNDYDPDAVRVEITGETVGYVANSPNTLVEGVKSASQIKRLFKNKIEAEILYITNGQVIAKLIREERK